MRLKLTSQPKRQELWLLSTPLQAAQASPEGWEKPPEWLSWTSDSRGQPSPSGAERCSQGCGRGSRGTAAGPAGKEEERQLNRVSPNSLKSGQSRRQRPKSAWRWSWAVCPGPRRGRLSPPHCSAQPGLGGGRQAPLGLSAQGRAPPSALGTPLTQVPAHTPWTRPSACPKAWGSSRCLGERRKRPQSKGNREGEGQSYGLA